MIKIYLLSLSLLASVSIAVQSNTVTTPLMSSQCVLKSLELGPDLYYIIGMLVISIIMYNDQYR